MNQPREYKGPARWLSYVMGRIMISILMRLPISLSWYLGRSLGWLLWLLLTSRRRAVRANLRIISKWARGTGQSDPLETRTIEAAVREVFMRNGANFTCGFSLSGKRPEQLAKHIEMRNSGPLRKATQNGRGAVLLLSHMGPWEALAHHLSEIFRAQGINNALGAIYRRFNNDYMDHWYKTRRESKGTTMFGSRYKFYAPVEFVRQGGILGILSDQRASGGEEVTYFGKTTKATPLPGLIHLRAKALWFRLSMQTLGFAKWRITIHEVPSHLDGTERNRKALAQTSASACQASLMESVIDGFWINNRFKDALEREAEERDSSKH